MNRKNKDILRAIRSFDVDEYARTGQLPEGLNPELADFAHNLFQAANKRYSDDLLRQQMRYAALQSQINPHFLYNTLECIRSEALLCQQSNIAEMTENLSRFFRYCISNYGDFVRLQDEIVSIKQYFFIQKYRFGDRFQLDIQMETERALQCHLPKMTLQPIVENSIYHGLERKKGQGTVTIRIMMTEKKLFIWIQDDGLGMTAEQVEEVNQRLLHPNPVEQSKKRGGIALTNVNARIQLHFGKEYGLRVSSILNRGTDVEIVLPAYDDLEFSRRFQQGDE